VKVTDWPAQIDVLPALMLTAGVTVAFTVIKTVFEDAVVGLAQAADDVTMQDTASLLASEEEV
jgi:hypothetical protein